MEVGRIYQHKPNRIYENYSRVLEVFCTVEMNVVIIVRDTTIGFGARSSGSGLRSAKVRNFLFFFLVCFLLLF